MIYDKERYEYDPHETKSYETQTTISERAYPRGRFVANAQQEMK